MVILAFSALCAGEAPDEKLKINKLEPHHSAALWPLIMECTGDLVRPSYIKGHLGLGYLH